MVREHWQKVFEEIKEIVCMLEPLPAHKLKTTSNIELLQIANHKLKEILSGEDLTDLESGLALSYAHVLFSLDKAIISEEI